jgi:signal peptidase II
LGGALGNLADRAREGAVIDWIDPVAWPAFNLADACIVSGVLMLLWVVEGRPGRARTS